MQIITDEIVRDMVRVLQLLAKDYPKIRREILGKLKLKEKQFDRDLLNLLNAFVAARKEMED